MSNNTSNGTRDPEKVVIKSEFPLFPLNAAFGSGANQAQLEQIASASEIGKVHTSSNTADLAGVFVDIATTSNVTTFLETEISKRISEAVSDKLSLEYFGS